MVSGYRKRLLASHMVAPERLKEEGSKEKKRECWSTRRWGSRDKGGGRRVHRKKKRTTWVARRRREWYVYAREKKRSHTSRHWCSAI